MEELVQWESIGNEDILNRARTEIRKSWRKTCAENSGVPHALRLFDETTFPEFHDPFAGGGTLPLEAQRLGLRAFATDLNPVAVVIEKAMIEIPAIFAGLPPVNPVTAQDARLISKTWDGATGLADDVRHYGRLLRDKAADRIGKLYPKVRVTSGLAIERPDLQAVVGEELPVVAWIWARTVKSPNPAFASADVPLISDFAISKKPGKEVYVLPVIKGSSVTFTLVNGTVHEDETKRRVRGNKASLDGFTCCYSGVPIPFTYIDAEANAGRMSEKLVATILDGPSGRLYLPPTSDMEALARSAIPTWKPEVPTRGTWASNSPGRRYGFETFGDYFSPRQLVGLTTLCDVLPDILQDVSTQASVAGFGNDDNGLNSGGIGARAYAEAVVTYLALAIDKAADYNSTLCGWISSGETVRSTFGRQAITMSWDYCEANLLGSTTGSIESAYKQVAKALEVLPAHPKGNASQSDAQTLTFDARIVSTDPPYYDNIAYADLSDFFYGWLRRSLRDIFPGYFATVATPKAEELVASAYRHGGTKSAAEFFLAGMTKAMRTVSEYTHPAFPITIYYAFKQTQTSSGQGASSSGWETFLDALIRSGLVITGTWPIRTERAGRTIEIGSNALASSIILVCRRRLADAVVATRREFISALKAELPPALLRLQTANIAPVDLAQASIGPGMAIYTRYDRVVDAEGKAVSVGDALHLINEALDDVLSKQDSDFDSETRWAISWFEQFGFEEGDYGAAETLTKAKVTSISSLVQAHVIVAKAGKVRLLQPPELASVQERVMDSSVSAWRAVSLLINALERGGEGLAASVAGSLSVKAGIARELTYRLYAACDKKRLPREARWYNNLVQSWPEIMRISREGYTTKPRQSELFEGP
jgi:putative DNA methylase